MPWWTQSYAAISLYLLGKRDDLTRTKTFDTSEGYQGFPPMTCPFSSQSGRTLDGTCNRPGSPHMGAEFTRFGRISPSSEKFLEKENILYPNPRLVSNKLLKREPGGFIPEDHVNLLAAAWIQFQNHDWFGHESVLDYGASANETNVIDVPLEPQDNFCRKKMQVPRTLTDDTFVSNPKTGLRSTHKNVQTTWWDLSQIYGQNQQKSAKIRTFKDGKLKVTNENLIPLDPISKVEVTGFTQNWWVGLSVIHNLFTREHNSIAEHLKAAHPEFSDEQLFQKARLVNAAVSAKIHTVEWTPTIIQSDFMYISMNTNWYGFSVVPGLVGNKDKYGITHQFSEEFVNAYRMHPMLPEHLIINPVSGYPSCRVPLKHISFADSYKVVQEHGFNDILNSFGSQSQGRLTLKNHPTFLTNFKIPNNNPEQSNKGYYTDIGTIDVLRDRERGLPRYNQYRRNLGMEPLKSIEEITTNQEHVKLLKEVYGNNIELVDLMVGQLAEEPRPTNFGFSDTTFQVFILTASRRLAADRFFTESFTDEVYTKEGMQWVRDATMKKLLIRNAPEMAKVLESVDNVFVPWENKKNQAFWSSIVANATRATSGLNILKTPKS